VGDSAYRHYDAGHLARLRFIRRAQAAGFTLEEIRELLDADGGADRTRVRALAEARLAALAAQQQELERSRRALEGLFEECSQAPSGPCPIIAAFETPAG
jgi:MerR family mercuric resistance operon transcriptional regulator